VTAKRRLGDFGEAEARRYLEAEGWEWLAANWICPHGELDLVMRDGDEVVFVEVKTRRGEGSGRAEEGVSPAKLRRVFLAAELFLQQGGGFDDLIWRVDLLALTLNDSGAIQRVTHVENLTFG